jgi:hypothetical protein
MGELSDPLPKGLRLEQQRCLVGQFCCVITRGKVTDIALWGAGAADYFSARVKTARVFVLEQPEPSGVGGKFGGELVEDTLDGPELALKVEAPDAATAALLLQGGIVRGRGL